MYTYKYPISIQKVIFLFLDIMSLFTCFVNWGNKTRGWGRHSLDIGREREQEAQRHRQCQFSHSVVSDSVTPRTAHARPPCPSASPRVCPSSCLLHQWCGPAISSYDTLPSFCPQSSPASGYFQISQLFTSGGQSIGVSASASILPMNIQDGFPLRWTGWISLLSKGLSSIFSNTTVQKHQFFCAQLSLQSNSHIHTRLLEKS